MLMFFFVDKYLELIDSFDKIEILLVHSSERKYWEIYLREGKISEWQFQGTCLLWSQGVCQKLVQK